MELQFFSRSLAVFAAVASAAAALFCFLSDPQVARQRLARVAAQPGTATAPRESLVDTGYTPCGEAGPLLRPEVAEGDEPHCAVDGGAGYHGPWPATALCHRPVRLPVVLFIASAMTLGTGRNLIFAVIAGAIGYFIPTLWLGRRHRAAAKGDS